MFYEEIRTKQDLSYISICSLSILYNSKFILMATSLGTNAVIVTRVHYRTEACVAPASRRNTQTLLTEQNVQTHYNFVQHDTNIYSSAKTFPGICSENKPYPYFVSSLKRRCPPFLLFVTSIFNQKQKQKFTFSVFYSITINLTQAFGCFKSS